MALRVRAAERLRSFGLRAAMLGVGLGLLALLPWPAQRWLATTHHRFATARSVLTEWTPRDPAGSAERDEG